MREKLSLSQFREIKEKLKKLIEYGETSSNDDIIIDDDEENERIERQYFDLQDKLLSYDLSDIPAEEWSGLELFAYNNHKVDFSNTNANIDFTSFHIPVDSDTLKDFNFKGCNISNIKHLAQFASLYPETFDTDVIESNPDLFLSDIFPQEFKRKFYDRNLSNSDIVELNQEQIQELKQKDVKGHFGLKSNVLLIETMGIDKLISLYNYSPEVFQVVEGILNRSFIEDYRGDIRYNPISAADFIDQMTTADVSQMKDICYSFARSNIITKRFGTGFDISDFPSLFVQENGDLFLTDENIPSDLKDRYFHRQLTIEDLFNNVGLFDSIPIDNFMAYNSDFSLLAEEIGYGNSQKLIKNHPDFARYLYEGTHGYDFRSSFREVKSDNADFETNIKMAVKAYIMDNMPDDFRTYDHANNVSYNVPNWMSSFNFNIIERIDNNSQLMNYDENTLIMNGMQQNAINLLGIDNLRKLEEETHIFSHQFNNGNNSILMFNALTDFFRERPPYRLMELNIDFQNGGLSYDDFKNEFAKCLNSMRQNFIFSDYPSYDWIEGQFRNEHPEIFIENDFPEELKEAFYKNRIDFDFIYKNKQYIPYLTNRNLRDLLRSNYKMNVVINGRVSTGEYYEYEKDFVDEYINRYGNEKFLNLIAKYGPIISNVSLSFQGDDSVFDDESKIEKGLRDSLYSKILNGSQYTNLINVPEFVSEHPDIFLSLKGINTISDDRKIEILKNFYNGNLSLDDIRKNPELVNLLKDKNLRIAFRRIGSSTRIAGRTLIVDTGLATQMGDNDLELLDYFDNETFLKLCSKYGNYLTRVAKNIKDNPDLAKKITSKTITLDELMDNIEEFIGKECILGNTEYSPEDAPDFLKQRHPELFLSDDAPEELKECFYGTNKMTFDALNRHKEWLPYLQNKSIATSLLRSSYLRLDRAKFFSMFGEEKAIRLGITRTETVEQMIANHKVELMKAWYDKTGGKFIPDCVVMQNFPLEQADKFLMSGSNWSRLMKIKSFSERRLSREAMLKLAYSFGAFDGDDIGFKKLQMLLTDIPRTISSDYSSVMDNISSLNYVDEISQEIDDILGGTEYLEKKEYDKLKDVLKSEGFDVNEGQEIFSQIYRRNNDGSYTLTINPQSYPKSTESIRKILETYSVSPVITPDMAHHYFGGFNLEYDADFREFFLKNLDSIISNDRYLSQISTIQKRFKEIKVKYSNTHLTLDLAMSYINNNRYENVNPGNERVTEVAAIQNYSQEDFDTLQQIYNYGKQRTFSSIPRVESKNILELSSGKYSYEMLRLDDPQAMSIGFESSCCQRLGEPAEVCMEHSMVDKNGRVFVIFDEKGEVVAQSWVWRNKDVLCFDNIEVPDKQMQKHGIPRGQEDMGIRNIFTDDILEIYKQAAHELIKADEQIYKELLDTSKITQEEYDGLRLGKITTGLGFSNIKGSLKTLKEDKGHITRPLPFNEPVKLSNGLYTNDSTVQYILEERNDRVHYNGETLPVHFDTYKIYANDSFTEKDLLYLQRLELITKGNPDNLETEIDGVDNRRLVSEIARNYNLNPRNTKIVMNPNFAVIYDEYGNELKIGDLLYNLRAKINGKDTDISDRVIMQMRMALDQISKDKNVDISSLSDEQKEIYQKAISLGEEIDFERGIGHAR